MGVSFSILSLSPAFPLYLDDLLADPNWCWNWLPLQMFVGALAYADDLTLVAPSPSALHLMLLQCEKFGKDHSISFIPEKTQSRRWGLPSSTSVKITFAGY